MMSADILAVVHDPVFKAAGMMLMAVLFAHAAWHKLAQGPQFQSTLQAYHLLPAALVAPASLLLAGLEALVPLGLMWPATRPVAMMLAALLLSGYGLAIAVNLLRGREHIDCGCGDETQTLSWALVVRNGLLAALAASCAVPASVRAMEGADIVTALLASLGFYGLYRVAEELIRQAGRLRALKELS